MWRCVGLGARGQGCILHELKPRQVLRRDGERDLALRIDGNDHELGGWIFDDYERLAEIRFGFVPEHYMVCISKEYIERLVE